MATITVYHVVYTTGDDTRDMFVTASSDANAWAAVQSSDPAATALVGVQEHVTNVFVGS